MYFNAKLSVTINGNPLTTVVSVKTSNDGKSIGGTCDVVVPLNAYIQYSDPNTLTTYLTAIRSDTFPQGSPIVITAQYEGYDPIEVFNGFIFDFVLGTPLTIKCMDYSYWFNLGVFGSTRVQTTTKKGKIKNTGVGVNYPSIQFRDLVQNLIDFVNQTIENEAIGDALTRPQPVSLILPVFDMQLVNITFISMSPLAILNYFKTNLGFNMTFYGNKLYINLASNTTGSVTLSTGRNVILSKLQTKLTAFKKIRLKCWFIRTNGTRDSFDVGDENGIQIENFFYNALRTVDNYEKLADAALLKAQQHHFDGELETLLYPVCDLFWQVQYTDLRYPEKNGTYVIIGVYFELNEKGFHRKLKVAFLVPVD